MTGRATGAGPGHPHHAAQRRLIGGHDGGFHLRLSDLQAVANHVLGAEAVFVHILTTGVASVRLNLSSRQHPSWQSIDVNSASAGGLAKRWGRETRAERGGLTPIGSPAARGLRGEGIQRERSSARR